MPRPFIIGVTGNIACGKSSVSRLLGEFGASIIDADRVYHELIQPGMPLQDALRDRFGDVVVGDDGQIDRKALGAIVFSDPATLADLDQLTHPAVVAETTSRIENAATQVVVVDAVKLYESGIAVRCDEVWLVLCNPETQLARLMSRNGIDLTDAERRIAAQPPLETKIIQSSRIIDNSTDQQALRAAVASAWNDVTSDRNYSAFL